MMAVGSHPMDGQPSMCLMTKGQNISVKSAALASPPEKNYLNINVNIEVTCLECS